jgi:hypothetical protein
VGEEWELILRRPWDLPSGRRKLTLP